MLKLDKKTWILFAIIIIVGFLVSFIIKYSKIDISESDKNLLKTILYIIILIVFYNKRKVYFSLKLFSKPVNLIYILPFILFFSYRVLQLDFSLLLSKNTFEIIKFFIAIYLAAFFEEFIFRGILINNYLRNNLSLGKSIIFAALIFGSFHLFNLIHTPDFFGVFNQMITAVFAGILFGALFTIVKNIYLVAFLHFIVNIPSGIKDLSLVQNDTITNTPFTLGEEIFSTIMVILLYSPLLLIGLFLIKRSTILNDMENMKPVEERSFI